MNEDASSTHDLGYDIDPDLDLIIHAEACVYTGSPVVERYRPICEEFGLINQDGNVDELNLKRFEAEVAKRRYAGIEKFALRNAGWEIFKIGQGLLDDVRQNRVKYESQSVDYLAASIELLEEAKEILLSFSTKSLDNALVSHYKWQIAMVSNELDEAASLQRQR